MAQYLLTSPKQYVAGPALVIIPLGEPPLGVAYWWYIMRAPYLSIQHNRRAVTCERECACTRPARGKSGGRRNYLMQGQSVCRASETVPGGISHLAEELI